MIPPGTIMRGLRSTAMRILLLPLLALTACAADTPAPPGAGPSLDPLAFFSGPSHGVGTISIMFKATQPLHVTSIGRPDGHGGIILEQTVLQGGEAPKQRHWNLRPTSTTSFGGTLSDASGPVSGSVSGNTLNLAFAMKGGLSATQTLALQPGGRVLLNHMLVKKFGFTVATIEERITKD
ncbi:MAG: DUF3833 family protein [Sphingomicrobium sp.]